MSKHKPRGICEGCNISPRALTQIESGQWVCQTCLREIRGPRRPKTLAALEQIEELRRCGFQVSDDLTKEEYRRLDWVNQLRLRGVNVAQNASLEDMNRLEKILSLRTEGIDLPFSATASVVEEALASATRVRHFFTKVAGVTYKNSDCSSRQRILARCQPLEKLVLVHEDENPVDSDAIAVKRQNGEQLGYLPAEVAADVAEKNRRGYLYAVHILAITGGQEDRPTLGCNLLVVVAQPGVSNQAAVDYINRVIATNKELLDDLGVDSMVANTSEESAE